MTSWNAVVTTAKQGNPPAPFRVEKSEEQWRAQLSRDQYHVMREKGTERAHSSDMCSLFEPGRYACAGCHTELFDSATKFESGTGWPSFSQALADDIVAYHVDSSYGMVRVEVTCNICDAHLGHVFPDGPPPSGLRFCINAVSLQKTSA